jgi:LGFP repeat
LRRRTALPPVGVLVAGLCVLAAALVPALQQDRVDVAEAANMSLFTPGNIIDDELFYDGSASTAAQIQSWLEARNPNCVAGSDGTPCLQDFRQTTITKPADDRCRGTYTGAANETAATIIAKVGRACGISQKVLLVILQKEQGLVTGSGSSLYATRYKSAMGMGCPDTSACDSQYFGFFNQVYGAARQYKTYQVYATRYGHRAGAVNQIRYSPDASCGSSAVYIQNQATAGLYNYTPYQPNAAALAAGKGTGDKCSAYGNRNFWIYYTDWFGSTHLGSRVIADEYARRGGAGGTLGPATSEITCGLAGGGCFQHYRNGSLYYSPATGVHAVGGGIYSRWAATGWEWGPLGYPTTDELGTPDGRGRYGHFQGGSIYWTQATGAHWLTTAIRDAWGVNGWEGGPLGYPTSDERVTPDGRGRYVNFQGGSVHWSSSTGAHATFGGIRRAWGASGWEGGPLGFPTTDELATPDGRGRYGHFQGGSIYWTQATGAHWLGSGIRDAWGRNGWEGGPLGYPTSDERATADGQGRAADFQGGSIYWHPDTGAHAVTGAARDAWNANGGESGRLGYPISDAYSVSGGTRVDFQHGSLTVDSSGRVTVSTS